MKVCKLVIMILLGVGALNSQIRTPPLSQPQKLTQKVGFTEVTIDYSRPLMRDRVIFGELVPFDEVWRTGANRNSHITFSESVTIDGQELAPGIYTIFTRPNQTEWDVYIYPYDNGYGVPTDFSIDSAEAIITVPVYHLNRDVQNLSINLDNVRANTADLTIMWERSLVVIPISFTTDKSIMDKISRVTDSHSGDYYMAAKYFLDNDKGLEQAKFYMSRSIALMEQEGSTQKYWFYQLQSEILLANGDRAEAKVAAEKALSMAHDRDASKRYLKEIEDLLLQIGL